MPDCISDLGGGSRPFTQRERSIAVNLHVLVVDPSPAGRRVLRRGLTLKRFEHHVLEAASLAEALVQIRQPGPNIDWLITDCTLPDSNGIELLQQLACEPRCQAAVGLLLATPLNDPALLARAKDVCVLGWAMKPVSDQQLEAFALRIIAAKSARQPS